ncbi:hypothetical protein QAD02_001688 [Eretmocerus hayati]|uniref:Uncharacterized protein n=1 Tax=Eretmocerus hayati TaxID=131215 RepID=A0ACC2NJC3_9HYME|nr:hypothetical protein QAD02_001688 [Eretmocerus hayati]
MQAQHTHVQQMSHQPQPLPQPPMQQVQTQPVQQQVQHVQHMQSMPMQQQVQQVPQQHQPIPQQQQVINQPTVVERQVSIQIKLPVHGNLPERLINVHVPASAIQSNQLHAIFTGPVITAAIALPTPFATSLLQQHVNATFENLPGFTPVPIANPVHVIPQSQATNSMMQQQLIQGQPQAREEEPLNSEDDVTDDDPADLFDTDNVVVCQYDKITRSRNKWKFYLKDGIMNLSGKDFVFQKANGDAEW